MLTGMAFFATCFCAFPVAYYNEEEYKIEGKKERMKENIYMMGSSMQLDTERRMNSDKNVQFDTNALGAPEFELRDIDGGSMGRTLSPRYDRTSMKDAEDRLKRDQMRIRTFMKMIQPKWKEVEKQNQKGLADEVDVLRLAQFAMKKMDKEMYYDEAATREQAKK